MSLFKKKVEDDFLDKEVKKESKLVATLSKKKVAIPLGVGVVVIVGVIIFSILGGNSDKLNYYDTLTSIFTSEMGTFKYVLDVRTGEKGSLIQNNAPIEVSEDSLKEVETVEATETVTEEETTEQETTSENKYEFTDWNKYSTVKSDAWSYPKYTITVEGATISADPVKTDVTIGIATENHNDVFTHVICDGENYYFDVESMYGWLANSGDDYLIELGTTLPNGSKWITIPVGGFTYPSSYAEVGELEAGLGVAKSTSQLYNRYMTGLSIINANIRDTMGKDGMTFGEGTVTLNLSGDSANKLTNTVKGLVLGSSDLYTGIINAGKEKGLYDDDQYKQAQREKDNFITAMFELVKYMNINDVTASNLQVGGFARTYVNNNGNTALEATLKYQYASDTTDHVVELRAFRSGDAKEITKPEGSTTTENYDLIVDAIKSMIAYFNTTKIDTAVSLENNPTTISEAILDKFIALVNETGTAGYVVTEFNVMDFIETYANYEETSESTDNDIINARLVMDLADTLQGIVGGIVIEKEVEAVGEVEQYPVVEHVDGNTTVTIKYNEEESDALIMVADVEIINRSDINTYAINLDEFSARTLLNSIYPANNEVMLRGSDSTFDMTMLQHEIEVAPESNATFKLYFALADDQGHFDLYLSGEKLNTLVQY